MKMNTTFYFGENFRTISFWLHGISIDFKFEEKTFIPFRAISLIQQTDQNTIVIELKSGSLITIVYKGGAVQIANYYQRIMNSLNK